MSRSRPVLLLLATVALLLTGAPTALAQTDPGPSDPGRPGPELPDPGQVTEPSFRLASRPPWVGAEDTAPFSIALDGPLEGATVRVELYEALDSVEELRESFVEDTGRRIFRTPALPVEQLAPGADGTRVVALKTSTSAGDEFTARLSDPGVHPLVLTLSDADGTVVDEIRTPVVRLGTEEEPLASPSLAVLLDVDAPPTLQPDGTRTLSSARLAALSRVGILLADHPDLELTVAATPDTIDALGASPDPSAAELLTQLEGREMLALPYLPLAVQSMRRSDLLGLVPSLVERGATVLSDRLGARLRAGVWDPSAELDAADADVLSGLGYEALLVPDGVPPDPDDPEQLERELIGAGPAPLAELEPLSGLVVDTELSEELASRLPETVDAAHVALAELLLRDDGAETQVLVRPRTLAAGSVLDGLLDLLDREGSPIVVGGLGSLDRFPEPETDPVEWGGRPAPSLSDIAGRVLADAARLETFAAIIDPRSSRADELRLQIATAVAATTPDRRREQAVSTVEQTLQDAFQSIRLAGQTDLNLTSRQGTLPITVENDNPFAVNVLIRVRSDRLSFPEGEVLAATVSPDGERIDVPVEALATGSVPVFVELWTGDDALKLDARQLNVRSTAVSGVGVALSLGALVVLVVWWARSWRRSRRDRGPHAPVD